jgi:hypothetical protein
MVTLEHVNKLLGNGIPCPWRLIGQKFRQCQAHLRVIGVGSWRDCAASVPDRAGTAGMPLDKARIGIFKRRAEGIPHGRLQ